MRYGHEARAAVTHSSCALHIAPPARACHTASSLSDSELCGGKVATNALGLPRVSSGNFADVYQIDCPAGRRWAIKCFTRPTTGLEGRYEIVSRYLGQRPFPFTMPFQYQARGIRVGGDWFPILKMEWVEGDTLNEFVQKNLDRPKLLDKLCSLWFKLAKMLGKARIAHGDLQHGNILLVANPDGKSVRLTLVDYDGMIVPGLEQTPSREVGHPAYQHPERIATGLYGLDVDRFSVLVIACGLRCLTLDGKDLWRRYDTGDNLLFKTADFEGPAESDLLQELWRTSDPLTRTLAAHVILACNGSAATVPLLESLAPDPEHPQPLAPDVVDRVSEILKRRAPVRAKSPSRPTPAQATPWWVSGSQDVVRGAPTANPRSIFERELGVRNYKKAIALLDDAINNAPRDAELFFLRARAHAGLHDTASALADYEAGLLINPGDGNAWLARGSILFESGAYRDAKIDFLEAGRCGCDAEKLFLALGSIHAQEGDHVEACEVLSHGISRWPDSPDPHLQRGVSLQAVGLYAEAIADIEKAIDQGRQDLLAFQTLGECLFASGNYAVAHEAFTNALLNTFTDPAPYLGRIGCSFALRNFEACRFDLKKALALAPDHPALIEWQRRIEEAAPAPRPSVLLSALRRQRRPLLLFAAGIALILCLALFLTRYREGRHAALVMKVQALDALLRGKEEAKAQALLEEIKSEFGLSDNASDLSAVASRLKSQLEEEEQRAYAFQLQAKRAREAMRADLWRSYSEQLAKIGKLARFASEKDTAKELEEDLSAGRRGQFSEKLKHLGVQVEHAKTQPSKKRLALLEELHELAKDLDEKSPFVPKDLSERYQALRLVLGAATNEAGAAVRFEIDTPAVFEKLRLSVNDKSGFEDFFSYMEEYRKRYPEAPASMDFAHVLAGRDALVACWQWNEWRARWEKDLLAMDSALKAGRATLCRRLLTMDPNHLDKEGIRSFLEWLTWDPLRTSDGIKEFFASGFRGPGVTLVLDRDGTPHYVTDPKVVSSARKKAAEAKEMLVFTFDVDYVGTKRGKIDFLPKTVKVAPHSDLARDILALAFTNDWRTWDKQMDHILKSIEGTSGLDPVYRLALLKEMCTRIANDHPVFAGALKGHLQQFREVDFPFTAKWMDPEDREAIKARGQASSVMKALGASPKLSGRLDQLQKLDSADVLARKHVPYGVLRRNPAGGWQLLLAREALSGPVDLWISHKADKAAGWMRIGALNGATYEISDAASAQLKEGMPVFGLAASPPP